MLQKVGLYKINVKEDSIDIRLPNPNDLIINWGNVNSRFRKDFVGYWHDTCILSNKKTDKQVYGISILAYRNLIILDHIAYMINHRLIEKEFEATFIEINKTYEKPLDLVTVGMSKGG